MKMYAFTHNHMYAYTLYWYLRIFRYNVYINIFFSDALNVS